MHALALDPARDDRPREDHVVVLQDVTWADYQRILEIRGDRSAPRIAYSEGRLEIMSPSKDHEAIKSLIGCLLEVYCLETGVEFSTFGSWTLEDKAVSCGVEPDECYVFGDARAAQRPHLAIDVVWTSGGIGKLEIHRALGVREVWFWRRGAITVHVLRAGAYAETPRSEALPGISIEEVASYLDRPSTSQAMRDYRDALRARANR
jgi:Uma2 family endonuclease